jgi:hypothetical protein
VKVRDERCYHHKGLSAVIVEQEPQPSTVEKPTPRGTPPVYPPEQLTEWERNLIGEAIDQYRNLLTKGYLTTAVDRATEYVGDQIWKDVTRGWSGTNCTYLAQVARQILAAKDELHREIGDAVGALSTRLGAPEPVGIFAGEFARRVQLPGVDDTLTSTARALQLTGIMICVFAGRNLADCACFVSVVIDEGKDVMQKLLVGAVHDWANLHNIPVR